MSQRFLTHRAAVIVSLIGLSELELPFRYRSLGITGLLVMGALA
jgi:hypothetical protein